MNTRAPIGRLPTHEVVNVPPHLGDQDLWADDRPLREWVESQGGGDHAAHLAATGECFGREAIFAKADQANRFGPELRAFDRYGMRLNAVEFHPAYHDLMGLAIANQVHNFAWHHEGRSGHVGQAALMYQFNQPEGGVMCSMSMTYSVVPALRTTPSIEQAWLPGVLSCQYDARDIPMPEKTGALVGMFMTEKQGGSDVRSNSTVAVPLGQQEGPGAAYRLTGHKFFCSAPMSDAFLVLARTEGASLSCFLVPRWTPDGERNLLLLQRIKEKLGNRSNASTEMELLDTHGVMVGEEGRGIRTIIEMVTGNRLYCAMSSVGLMRQALVQALHHTRHRSAFQKRLVQQPLMQNVLADLALEVEAALALGLRVARAMDSAENKSEAALARIGTAIAKYWNTKRCPPVVGEALECHGGAGYIEESIMPRLYREAPLNSIWEGSGNVMALDVLRAMDREPEAVPSLLAEIELARGNDARLDRAIDDLREELNDRDGIELRMRTVTEMMALTLQGSLLTRHAPSAVAEAFCASRLAPRYRGAFGTLPAGLAFEALIERALPA